MSFDIAVADTYHESSVRDMKSDNYTFIYFAGQYCCLTLNVNEEILKIFWTSFYHKLNICFRNKIYKHDVAFYIWLLKRHKTSWTCIYKILWGSIFQGCYGQGKVRGKQIIF